MRQGLSQAEDEYVLQGELDYILNDVIARPVDPAALDTLSNQSIDPNLVDPNDLVCR
jgi:hypothetical protein